MVGPVVTRMVVPSGLAPFTAHMPISPSPPVVLHDEIAVEERGKILRQLAAQHGAAAAGREGKNDPGQRSGLSERLAHFDRQRQADASRNEPPAVHLVLFPS